MSCSVCNGHPGCPCCAPAPNMIPCPECDGSGYTYYDEEGDVITKDEYDMIEEWDRSEEPCDYCEGTGEIKYDNEPDYDNYNE